MRLRLVLMGGLLVVTVALLGVAVPSTTSAQQDMRNHEEILRRLAAWKQEYPPEKYPQFYKGIAFDLAPAPSPSPTPLDGKAGKGYAIHVAVEKVDPAAYPGTVDNLPAVHNDLREMEKIAQAEGFTPLNKLVNEGATRAALEQALFAAAKVVKSGETLLVTYSGHGSFVTDQNGDETDDQQDETWCLYDGHFLDDNLINCWNQFEAGVRIVVVLDSCHSSSATKNIKPADIDQAAEEFKKTNKPLDKAALEKITVIKRAIDEKTAIKQRVAKPFGARSTGKLNVRLLPPDVAVNSYLVKKAEYDNVQNALRNLPALRNENLIKARVVTLGACKDDQTALDDGEFGFFTREIVRVWNNRTYPNNYQSFLDEVRRRVKDRAVLEANHRQEPTYLPFGAADQSFDNQRPFNR